MAEKSAVDSKFLTKEEQSIPQGIPKEPRSDTSSTGSAKDKDPKTVQESGDNDEREYITGIKLGMVVVGVTLVAFLVMLDTSIIATAIPRITTQFHSLEDLGWYGSSYQIASACLQPLAGKIYTNFRTKWVFLSFFFIFELGSLLCGIATSSKMLIVARAVAGLGSAGLMNGSLTIVSSSVPLHKSPRMLVDTMDLPCRQLTMIAALLGMMMGFSQLGVVLGPVLGGAFTEYTTWRWCFYINLPVGALVALLLVFINIPDQAAKPPFKEVFSTITHKLDLTGFVLFAPAAIQLLLALEYGQNEYPWNSATVIGLFCGAGATFLLFLAWEYYQADKAMIPLAMVAKREVWSSCLVMVSIFAITLSMSFYLPVYFQAIQNRSPMISGVYVLPSIVSQIAVAVTSGALIGKMGYYLPWAVASGILTSIGGGLFSTLTPYTATGKWVGYQILAGAGRGAGFQIPIVAIQNTLPPSQISIAMSILMFIQTLSGAVFVTFADVIFSTGLRTLIPKYEPDVNAQVVIAAGATGIRDVVSEQQLPGILKAYAKSVDHVFYLVAAMGVVAFLFSFGMGWKDIRKKKPATEQV
ncbi:Efflux pump mlcE [Penicillium rolfsii]|nr:Efflux pump mlcE [Penicillium rolfsii]